MTTAVIPEVAAVGGAFAEAVADIELYTDPKRPLQEAGQRAIADLLKKFPELNTKTSTSMLVDLVAYYGVAPKRLAKLTEDIVKLDLRKVFVAVEYLYEYGETAGPDECKLKYGDADFENRKTGVKSVRNVASLLARIEEATSQPLGTAEELHAFIETVGGFKKACSLDVDDIIQVLGATPRPQWDPMSDADYRIDTDWEGDTD